MVIKYQEGNCHVTKDVAETSSRQRVEVYYFNRRYYSNRRYEGDIDTSPRTNYQNLVAPTKTIVCR